MEKIMQSCFYNIYTNNLCTASTDYSYIIMNMYLATSDLFTIYSNKTINKNLRLDTIHIHIQTGTTT